MSENVEMYLVSIARMAEADQAQVVPIPALADQLDIMPVSANQMIRRLEENGLVRYLPYKGVQLTEAGRKIADQVRRNHRLWETFLVRFLNFPPQTADTLACRLEHILSDEEIDRLAAFLAHPEIVLGEKVRALTLDGPDTRPVVRLSDCPVGQRGIVKEVSTDRALASFLRAAGVQPGAELRVVATADSGDVLVLADENERVHLSADLAGQVWLAKGQA